MELGGVMKIFALLGSITPACTCAGVWDRGGGGDLEVVFVRAT